jgi:hypothetical protein
MNYMPPIDAHPQNPTAEQTFPLPGNPIPSITQSASWRMNSNEKGMSEQAIRIELDHRERTAEAKSDVKFERMLGELRTSLATFKGEIKADIDALKASTASKLTVVVTGLSVGISVIGVIAALVFGMATSGQQMFGLGASTRDIATSAAKEAAAQVIAAQKPSP